MTQPTQKLTAAGIVGVIGHQSKNLRMGTFLLRMEVQWLRIVLLLERHGSRKASGCEK